MLHGTAAGHRAHHMEHRWHWAESVDPQAQAALMSAFRPDAMEAVAVPGRSIAGRGYAIVRASQMLGWDAFVKIFDHRGPGARLRHLWGRSGAQREFANAVRLHSMGLPVPQPLALVDECTNWGCRRTYYLMEYVPGALPLGAAIAASGPAWGDDFRALAVEVARLVTGLAAKGVWHRDLSAANILVAPGAADRPVRVWLIDARHALFGKPVERETLSRMLVALAAFLLVDGAADEAIEGLLAMAAQAASQRGGSLAAVDVRAVLGRARKAASDLLARQVRKGRRPVEDLDLFARRYGSALAAENYRDRRFARSRHGRRVDAAERRIIAGILAATGVRGPILDVPCGAGRLLPLLAAGGRLTIGVDVSEAMLGLARQAAGDGPALLAADARRLPFPAGCFELAMAMRLLHRVRRREERMAVLAELARVSRTWVVFSFYNRRSWRALRDRLRGRYAGQSRAEVKSEADEAGLVVEQFLPAGPFARETVVLCRTRI